MYTEHFRLKSLPFENVPDPKFFFNQGNHSKVRKQIAESLNAGRGLMVVTGPMGSGKTTLSQILISEFASNIKMIWIAMPPENSSDLFLFLAQELGLKPTSAERTFILRDIRDALSKNHEKGHKCLVIIDESHLMSADTINGLRLLNNLEAGSIKLIQILLLGQEELLDLINQPENEHFKQRIATLETLNIMGPRSIHKYILHRLIVAGGRPAILSQTGMKALILAFGSGSTPRTINSLCDRSFNICFQKRKRAVDVDDVYEAAEDMGLQKNVFLYKIELKQKQKKLEKEIDREIQKETQQRSQPQNTSARKVKEIAQKMAVSTSPVRKERVRPVAPPPKPAQDKPTAQITELELSAIKENQKLLNFSFLLLVSSIFTFCFSLIFYIKRCNAPDALTCLLELFSF